MTNYKIHVEPKEKLSPSDFQNVTKLADVCLKNLMSLNYSHVLFNSESPHVAWASETSRTKSST